MKAFVYCVTNVISGKRYIGKTINPIRRWTEHLSLRNVSGGRLLRFSMKKYGSDVFLFQIFGDCSSETEAYELERELIIEFSTVAPNGFNLSEGGRGCFSPADELRERMCLAQQKRFQNPVEREKLRQVNSGKVRSEETKKRMRKPKSLEHREKLRQILIAARAKWTEERRRAP